MIIDYIVGAALGYLVSGGEGAAIGVLIAFVVQVLYNVNKEGII